MNSLEDVEQMACATLFNGFHVISRGYMGGWLTEAKNKDTGNDILTEAKNKDTGNDFSHLGQSFS